ncbi:hypothetical protein Lfu02_01150 [Longispora fulva]|uniref:Uncharacterized protein n=1 Tax=Longispora fulva TaxID=619741 RepID=A0A8J7GE54_9ACTN|nr:hypothetical protein [Longispora fulva]MBG6136016.1 hypothetical protein [Longispora fulva]GIG55743.1 hypothetical protein Lfu02_01150 [Longispora fulva]
MTRTTPGRCACHEVGEHLVACHALLTFSTHTLTDLASSHAEPRLTDAADHGQAAITATQEAARVLTRTCPTHRAARRAPGLVAIALALGATPAAIGVTEPIATALLIAAGVVSLRVAWLTCWAVRTMLATRRATRTSTATMARIESLHRQASGPSVMAVTAMVGDTVVAAGIHADAAGRLDVTGSDPARAVVRAILTHELPAHLDRIDDALTDIRTTHSTQASGASS